MNYKFSELTKRKTETNKQNYIQQDFYSNLESIDKDLSCQKLTINERKQVLLKAIILLISGMVTALSMPGFNLCVLPWFGFIPLISTLILEKSLNRSLLYSYSYGFGFYALSLNWFLALHPLNWLGLNNIQSIILSVSVWFVITAYLSCYTMLFGLFARTFLNLNAGYFLKSVIIALCWVIIMNKLTSIGQFAFPWALIEYSQFKNLNLLQIAQYIGGIGIGFLILFYNSFMSLIFTDFIKKKLTTLSLIKNTACILSFVISFHIIGLIILNNDNSVKTSFTATIIQNNSTLAQKADESTNLASIKQSYLSKIHDSPSGIIVIPEVAVYDYIRYKDRNFFNNLDKISRLQDKTILIGALDILYNYDGKSVPTNSAIITDKQLPLLVENTYNKQVLVPFGEFIPFRKALPTAFNNFINKIAGTDFYPDNQTKVFKTNIGNIAPTICYEIVFPDLTRKQAKKQADILVNLSSLCWYHDSIIKDQFIAFGVMRAAEYRKPYIIAVNTGHSVFINYNGKILKQFPKNKAVTESIKMNYCNDKTFYSQLFI